MFLVFIEINEIKHNIDLDATYFKLHSAIIKFLIFQLNFEVKFQVNRVVVLLLSRTLFLEVFYLCWKM